MSREPLKAGDTVKLIATGRVMTVTHPFEGVAYCFWQEDGQKRHALYPQNELQRIEGHSERLERLFSGGAGGWVRRNDPPA